jgi:DNA-binding NtrC family response regulator
LSDKKVNILLVDDEEALLESMRRRLQFRDFNVIAVSRGEKALEMARTHPIDVAIVDMKMPGMSGMEVLAALKEEYPWMEVIILTGHGTFSPEEEAIAEKCHACLTKPCDLATIQQALTEAYKKTVMNRHRIKTHEMDKILNEGINGSSVTVLRKLMEVDDNQQ